VYCAHARRDHESEEENLRVAVQVKENVSLATHVRKLTFDEMIQVNIEADTTLVMNSDEDIDSLTIKELQRQTDHAIQNQSVHSIDVTIKELQGRTIQNQSVHSVVDVPIKELESHMELEGQTDHSIQNQSVHSVVDVPNKELQGQINHSMEVDQPDWEDSLDKIAEEFTASILQKSLQECLPSLF
jgi:hypothetical protein